MIIIKNWTTQLISERNKILKMEHNKDNAYFYPKCLQTRYIIERLRNKTDKKNEPMCLSFFTTHAAITIIVNEMNNE